MKWINAKINKEADKIIGQDVLIQDLNGQYIAGHFGRTANGIVFMSSDGAWNVELREIKRFVLIED